jgi:hypothetical protein
MNQARTRALLLILVLAAIAAAALVIAGKRNSGADADVTADAAANRPTLLLLTSLPLIFNENFSLQGGGSAALRALEGSYRVRPISVADGAELAKGRLLLAAHPLAQTPENLVVLDEWVRRGGRLLLLADPMLEWPSDRPLGDPVRPPPMFMDTGLLRHWGLRLEAPDQRGPAPRQLGGRTVMTVSPGTLHGKCAVSGDRLVARCKVGEGRATVVADADLLDVEQLGGGGDHNLDGVLEELANLARA